MLKTHSNIRLLFTTIAVLGIFISCSKSPKCWGENKNKGIIENSIRIDCEPATAQQEFIITNDSAYEQLFTDSLTGQLNCSPPYIDFSYSSLLGRYTTGDCEVKYIREVNRIDSEEKYHYKVIVKSCGTCKKEGYSFNWITVPKIPDGWIVTFETEHK